MGPQSRAQNSRKGKLLPNNKPGLAPRHSVGRFETGKLEGLNRCGVLSTYYRIKTCQPSIAHLDHREDGGAERAAAGRLPKANKVET